MAKIRKEITNSDTAHSAYFSDRRVNKANKPNY